MSRRGRGLELAESIKAQLVKTTKSRTASVTAVRRAKILLEFDEGASVTGIARKLGTNRPLVERTIDKALVFDPIAALKDLPRPGQPKRITDDAKAWVLSIACEKPQILGYAHESWTYSLMLKHIHANCESAGYPGLLKLGKGRLNDILAKSNVKPHKLNYYLAKKDPEFEEKMANVLCVYKQVEMQNVSSKIPDSVTISYDEKPGIQALGRVAADLMPKPGTHPSISRDYEYRRLGTLSLLAGIDLHTGEVIPLIRDRHRSREFIEFLEKVDNHYPKAWKIRVILDNHSAHISKETQAYLLSRPGRFDFVFTPKHGSWLNMIEVFFSKISRSFLRHIRVESKQELVDRIYQGIEQINQEPVIFRWSYKMDETAVL